MRYLEQKRRVWWYKRAIPVACRDAFGGLTTYRESLGTSDIRVAKERRDILNGEVSRLFAEARAGRAAMDPSSLAAQRGQFWREALAELEEAAGETEEAEEHLDITRDAVEAEAERLSGTARRAFEAALWGHVSVDEHVEDYLNAAGLAPKTTNERRGLVKRFAAWAEAEGLKLDAIDRRAVGRYVTQVIDPMDPATAKKHMTALRQYWVFLHNRGLVDGADDKGGPWAGQKPKSKATRATRTRQEKERAFKEEEVKALLYSPWPERLDRKHREQVLDAIRISLLTGMRLDEVLSLWVEDVGEGVFVIREGKTAAAAREVPIHPDLEDTVARRVRGKGPKDWLFHELRSERDPSDTFGKRFRRYRLKVGVDDKREDKRRSLVNFHSARRWFITQARYAGNPKETIAEVVGHRSDPKDMTFGVYTRGASKEQRRDCVESIKLPQPD